MQQLKKGNLLKTTEIYQIELSGPNQLKTWLNVKALVIEKLSNFVIIALLLRFAFPVGWWQHEGLFRLLVLFASFALLYHLLDVIYIIFTTPQVNISFANGHYIINIEGNEATKVNSFTNLKALTKYKNPFTSQLIIDLHWEDGFVRLGSPTNNEQLQNLLKQIEAFTGLKAERKVFERKRRQYGYPYTAKQEDTKS